jgi:hypothetical protein
MMLRLVVVAAAVVGTVTGAAVAGAAVVGMVTGTAVAGAAVGVVVPQAAKNILIATRRAVKIYSCFFIFFLLLKFRLL